MKRTLFLLPFLIIVFLESSAQPEVDHQKKSVIFQKDYRGIVEIGYASGTRTHGSDHYRVNALYGYQFSPFLFVGAGLGLRSYKPHPIYDFPLLISPVFANVRVNFNKKKISPFVSAYGGRSFDWQYNLKDAGMLVGGNVGIRFAFFEKTALHFGIGQEMQRSWVIASDPHSDWTGSANLDRYATTLTLGITILNPRK